MKLNLKFVLETVFGIFFLFLYCDYLIFFLVQKSCDWPKLNPENEDRTIQHTDEEPVRVMVIADTHLLGSRRGHWFDKLRREWQMNRAFQTAMYLHKPDLVFVLGDLTDEGLYCSDAEFDYYVRRFYTLFQVPDGTRLYVAVGNHDIGFHYGISPYLNQRFVTAFNAPAIQLISVRGNHFVLVNSMALEGDGCFLCKPAEHQLMKIERILQCTKGTYYAEKCTSKSKLDIYSRPILMQLLNQIKPRIALSGHTHHGCTRPLPTGDGIEVTIPSFSWRNKDDPNYLLAVFTPNNYAYTKCEMPRESTVIALYIFGCTLLIIWLLYSLFCRSRVIVLYSTYLYLSVDMK
ncbi:hypothetical protein NQ318_000765 [Aromia moschata]|uniref:Calcineurin-like phosphoesterase domain-containing protein n=1 Tax=Aromia moschata TaxID=1265417 RepID=A0AAV8YSA1_9CUCU|nr:hypothetical protein NQ318_000765 [Aromia moschata]